MTSILQNKLLNEFELEQKLIPSFINSNNRIKSLKTEIYLASNNLVQTKKIYCPILKDIVNSTSEQSTTVSCLISTYANLKAEEDETKHIKSGDSKLNNYLNYITTTEYLDTDKQLMYLQSLIYNLRILREEGIDAINLFTDSNYILFLLKSNIFRDTVSIGYDIKNREVIQELYELCGDFEYIFMSYYSGNIMPSKLRYAMDKSKEVNLQNLSDDASLTEEV